MKQQSAASVVLVLAVVALAWGSAQASQGCPFDDGSCQEYCSQQGCNMGYCGHFAWIQCICRKCGDEWSWYDKVRYNPDKTVNQTELDSLKLNATSPLILTNTQNSTGAAAAMVAGNKSASAMNATGADAAPAKQTPATLTTLLIPDLSDSSKLDMNDIPDENSDKFLDYLAKNHERLVQATSSAAKDPSAARGQQQQQTDSSEESSTDSSEGGATSAPEDETVEIQISTNNNSSQQQQPQPQSTTSPSSGGGGQEINRSPVVRLLRMAVERQIDEHLPLNEDEQ